MRNYFESLLLDSVNTTTKLEPVMLPFSGQPAFRVSLTVSLCFAVELSSRGGERIIAHQADYTIRL